GTSLSATAISPHDGAVCMIGTNSGQIQRTESLGTQNQFSIQANPLFSSNPVTWIEFDPFDSRSRTVYATQVGYGGNRVIKTNDGGATWFSIHANLPNIPLFCLKVDPRQPHRVFLGSELGLWVGDTGDGQTYHWRQYDYGAALTRVIQMV